MRKFYMPCHNFGALVLTQAIVILLLYSLDHFSKLRARGSLDKGDDIVLSIEGGCLECKCSNGGYNVVESEVFTKAVCDVYFGNEAISPSARSSVLAGMEQL